MPLFESQEAPRRARGAFAPMESLEPRTLLAAVSWTGLAGDFLWSNPMNWSTGSLPSPADDVRIDAGLANPTIRFTADAGVQRVNSLVTLEAFAISGGELTVASQASLAAGLTVTGGSLGGGAWSCSAATFAGASSRIVGPLAFSGSLTTLNTAVRVQGEFRLNGTATINGGSFDFASDVTLDSGVFTLANGRLGLVAEGATSRTMTIGAGATVKGYGNVGNALFSENLRTTLVNLGTLQADSAGRFLVIAPVGAYASTFTNSGLVRATGGGVARVAATDLTNHADADFGTLTGGVWRADANSTVMLDYSRTVAVNRANIILGGANASFSNLMDQLRVNEGSITLGMGMQWARYFGVSNNGLITLESISSLSLPVQGTHSGTFVIGAGSFLTTTAFSTFLPGSSVTGSGTLQFTTGRITLGDRFGPASTVRLLIGRNASVVLAESITLGSVDNQGLLDVGTHLLTLTGNYSQASTGVTNVDLVDELNIGGIRCAGSVTMGGTLHADSSVGFDPAAQGLWMFTAVVLTGGSFSGAFATVTQIGAAAGAMSWVFTPHSLELWHNIADFNGDGGVDGADLAAFLFSWEQGRSYADVNGDGGVDGADLESFLRFWAAGGR